MIAISYIIKEAESYIPANDVDWRSNVTNVKCISNYMRNSRFNLGQEVTNQGHDVSQNFRSEIEICHKLTNERVWPWSYCYRDSRVTYWPCGCKSGEEMKCMSKARFVLTYRCWQVHTSSPCAWLQVLLLHLLHVRLPLQMSRLVSA